jgi:hypothetical protein
MISPAVCAPVIHGHNDLAARANNLVLENTLEGKAMKPTLWFASVLVAVILGGVVGAGVVIFMGWQERPRAEGIIYSVEYQQGNGTGG